MRFAMGAFQSRNRSLVGMRGLGAFDPRTRSLNGLACACQQQQNMSRLGRFARGHNNPLARGVGRLGWFGRLGDDSTDFSPAEDYFLDTGTDLTAPLTSQAAIDSTYNPFADLTPPSSSTSSSSGLPLNLSTPQQIAAQQIWGTTSITPAQNQALINAQTSGINLANMTPAQAAAIKALVAPAITSSLLVYGAIGLGLLLLLTKK